MEPEPTPRPAKFSGSAYASAGNTPADLPMMFKPKPVGAAVAVVLSLSFVGGAAARPAADSAKPRKQPKHRAAIYWGAYMEGPSTYGGQYRNAPWDDGTWHAFERTAGKRVSIVHWGVPPPWQASFNAQLSQHKKILRAGALELLDMASGSVPLADVAAGKYDTWIYQWAKQAREFGHPLFLRWDWEMNGRWFTWATMPGQSTTAEVYVAAWQHIHKVFDLAGAKNVSWVWCPNVAFGGSTPFDAVYPGPQYVDWTCLDGYNKGGQYSTTFVKLFAPSYRALLKLAPDKPMMIGETASVDDSGKKPGWISAALAALPTKFPRIKAFLWFNWNINEDGTTWAWQIESSPESAAAFARGIASRYYAPAGRVRLPKRMTASMPPP
jgi:hypothetical protein